MLFLGAGASRPFGIPTMKGLTKEILGGIAADGQARETLHKILRRLKQSGFNDPDIEAIMDVLTARQDLEKARSNIGPKIIEFTNARRDSRHHEEATIMLEMIESQVEARCSKADYDQADAYYQRFFENAPGGLQAMGGRKVAPHYMRIFTTNYDLCIDKFLRKQGYYNGFDEKEPGDARTFSGKWHNANGLYILCKLHGSIDWYEIGGRVTQLTVRPRESLYGEKIEGRRMVYPATEKYALRSPYAECLFYLREQLKVEGICVVIGYSFRDTPINNAFVDGLRFNPSMRIFSLGPRASIHKEELDEPLRSKITPIDAEFGTERAISEIQSIFSGGKQ